MIAITVMLFCVALAALFSSQKFVAGADVCEDSLVCTPMHGRALSDCTLTNLFRAVIQNDFLYRDWKIIGCFGMSWQGLPHDRMIFTQTMPISNHSRQQVYSHQLAMPLASSADIQAVFPPGTRHVRPTGNTLGRL